MKGIVIFFSLKEKNRAKETIVDEKGTILVQIQIMILHLFKPTKPSPHQ